MRFGRYFMESMRVWGEPVTLDLSMPPRKFVVKITPRRRPNISRVGSLCTHNSQAL